MVGLGLTTLVLFGRDAASYVSTTYHRLTELGAGERAGRVSDRPRQANGPRPGPGNPPLDARDRQGRSCARAAQQADRPATRTKADKDKNDILRLQADLGQNKDVYHYASRTYTCDEVKQDLARRFNRFKVADDTLASMKQMRDAREKNLDAAQQKLAAMINARRKLEVDVQNLEAKRKLVEVAQASSDYVFDDSQLARAKELITDIRTRLDVAAKLANADVNVEVGDSAGRSRPGGHHRPGDRVLQARRQGSRKRPGDDGRRRSRRDGELSARSKLSVIDAIAACGSRASRTRVAHAADSASDLSTSDLVASHVSHLAIATSRSPRGGESGRYDEASALLADESLREFLPAKRLAQDVAGKMVERAGDRFARGDSAAGWQDLAVADRLGGQAEAISQLRQQYADAIAATKCAAIWRRVSRRRPSRGWKSCTKRARGRDGSRCCSKSPR